MDKEIQEPFTRTINFRYAPSEANSTLAVKLFMIKSLIA